jgi:hypothetical protein
MNLNEMTVSELRKLAAEYDIAGRSTMKKAQLVAAIEFAYAKADAEAGELLDEVLGTETDVAAQVQAHIDAENEARAAAQRKRNRTNYATPNEVAILRDAPGRAIVTAAFDGRTVGGSIVRIGRRYMLTAGTITIKANTFEKIAKLFAKRLGFRADVIDIDRTVC